jgi:cytidine deaminase
MTLGSSDQQLLEMACKIMGASYKAEWHSIACAMRTRSGRVFLAVHLEAHVGRIAVCAVAIALGMGAAEGDTAVELAVAVDHEGNVVAPCGMCRELISDYSSTARVIVPSATGLFIVNVGERCRTSMCDEKPSFAHPDALPRALRYPLAVEQLVQ